MKILFVAPRFHTNQYQVVKTLQEKGHEVTFHVAFSGPTEDHRLLTPTNFRQSVLSRLIEKVFGKDTVKRPYYFPSMINYWSELKKLKPDLIVIRDPFKYFSLLVAIYALLQSSKILFYTQEELYRKRSSLNRLKIHFTLLLFKARWMTPILGINNGDLTKPKNMFFVPLPIPTKTNAAIKTAIKNSTPQILMIGKYHQDRKKHMLFIQALNKLREKYNFNATIVGECVMESQLEKYNFLQQTLEQLGLTEIIKLRKNIPFYQMEKLYETHDIFVLPAINEQYGVSVTEALANGLPVICTDTCGARFNIINGENGYIVKSSSLEDLTNAIEQLVSNEHRLTEMSKKAAAYIKKELSGEAFYRSFSKFMI